MGSAPRMADVLEGNPRLLQAVLDPSFFLPIPEREELALELDERLTGRRDAAERVEQVAAWAGDRRFQPGPRDRSPSKRGSSIDRRPRN